MKKWIATFAIVVIAGAALAFWFVSGPSASDFADLRTPRITRVQNQRMLVVQAKGDAPRLPYRPKLDGRSV
jgi:hypothetical protein